MSRVTCGMFEPMGERLPRKSDCAIKSAMGLCPQRSRTAVAVAVYVLIARYIDRICSWRSYAQV